MGYLGKGPGIRTVLLLRHKSVGWSYVRTLLMSNPLRIYCARYLARSPMASLLCRRRGRDAGYPTPPAQIPACGFSAPGSSVRRASALPMAGRWLSSSGRLACGLRPYLSGTSFLGGLRPTVTSFPLWTALPPSEDDAVIRLPMDHQPPSG